MIWFGSVCSGIAVVLILFEMFGLFRPTRIHCRCGKGWMAGCHYKSWVLLVIAVAVLLSAIFAVSQFGRAIAMANSAYYFWRWWQHSKDQRKKLKDKVLGVVRETAAGLKVVPAPNGAS